jgi:SPP1 family predicted phage head-tail adaptor
MIRGTCSIRSRLRHKMQLQEEVRTPDDAGGYARSWKTIAEPWAEIMPYSGNERLLGAQLQAEITHIITLRYRAGVTSAMRLVFEKRAFNIRSVRNAAERDNSLEIAAVEGNY